MKKEIEKLLITIGLVLCVCVLIRISHENGIITGKRIGFQSGYASAQLDIMEIAPNAPTPGR